MTYDPEAAMHLAELAKMRSHVASKAGLGPTGITVPVDVYETLLDHFGQPRDPRYVMGLKAVRGERWGLVFDVG